jgi:hypothetical protein
MIVIVIVPVGMGPKRLSEIYFLGSLLDRNPTIHEAKSADGFLKRDVNVLTLNMPKDKNTGVSHARLFWKESDIIAKKKYYDFRQAPASNMEKAIPGRHIKGAYKQDAAYILSLDVRPETRKILFKPPLPDFTQALARIQENDDLSARYNIEALVSVENSGAIKSVNITKTSGVSDLDTIIRDYVKRCRFEPVKTTGIQELALSVDIAF